MLSEPYRVIRTVSFLLLLLLLAGCTGPRMQMLSQKRYAPLPPDAEVEVYVGQLASPYEPVAIIDSRGYAIVDDDTKLRQIEELQAKARELGANVLHDVRLLPKSVKGMTVDERVPFTAWKQGNYELYFMRAVAIRRPPTEPASLAEARPSEGWLVEHMTVPPRLSTPIAEMAQEPESDLELPPPPVAGDALPLPEPLP